MFTHIMEHVIALSGGKDSTAMALRLRELRPSRQYTYLLTPTGDELLEMDQHWAYLENELGNLTRVGDKTLIQLIHEKRMLPNFRARWCTKELKIIPFINYMETLDPDSIMYVGLRADEEGRLGIIDSSVNVEYPMREWGWELRDVLNYLEYKGVEIPERTDCGCCFFQRLGEWKNLLDNYPLRYEKYVQIEKQYGHTFRSPQRDTWPADLDSLRNEFLSGRKIPKRKYNTNRKCRFCTM